MDALETEGGQEERAELVDAPSLIGHNRPPSAKANGDKHHYIPKFYLKQWVGADGRLCEFSRPYKASPENMPHWRSIPLRPRLTHVDGTGYQRGLYTFSELAPNIANYLEKRFLQRADD